MPNLSQIKRQRMMGFLAQIKEEHKDDDAMLIALGEIESELNAKKYGLVWEEHEEAVDVKMRTRMPEQSLQMMEKPGLSAKTAVRCRMRARLL
jgi:adenine-specific DNA-methyltransferase